MNKICANCQKEIAEYLNYCSWECNIELAWKEGGKVHTPNNLPIKCIKFDGTMLEHEHGDHPTYICPVEVEYTGTANYGISPNDNLNYTHDETHALIYTDGKIALTLYECCYAMWYLRNGDFAGAPRGSLWKQGEWKLSSESIEKIKKLMVVGENREVK